MDDFMAGVYPRGKTDTGIDCVESIKLWGEPSGAQVSEIETKGSKETKETEARHSNDQFKPTEKIKLSKDIPAFSSAQLLPSSTDTERRPKASQQKPGFIELLNNAKARLNAPIANNDCPKILLPESELSSILEEACDTAEKLAESQKKCKMLQEQVLEHQKELRDAHDFIFSLQPGRKQITESEAVAEFRSLSRAVEDWVETNLEDDIYGRSIEKSQLPAAHVKRFLTCISLPGKEASRCPDTDVYNVIAAIMKFLCIEIFDKDFYCPIEEGAAEFLDTVLLGMRNLEPKRDISTLRRWRSETFTALTGRPMFANQRKRHLSYLVAELTHMLLLFLPRSNFKALAPSIHTAIIEPALSLAHKLHLSVDKFSLSWTPFSRTRPEERSTDQGDYNNFECVDFLRSGRVMKSQAIATAGNITYMLDLIPALVFEEVKADSFAEPKVLNRGRILVAATKKGEDGFIVPQKDSGEPTSVAWLFDMWRKYN